MSRTFDGDLRTLERAYCSSPDDPRLARRYLSALRRAGQSAEATRVRFRLGEQTEACAEVGIRWEVDPQVHGQGLAWRGEPLDADAVSALVADDLRQFDPARLIQHWPRTKDGSLRLNTTQFLRRYPAHEQVQAHRRLILVAWTPGTSTLITRPEDRGKQLITVGLETRSTRKAPLDPACWRS